MFARALSLKGSFGIIGDRVSPIDPRIGETHGSQEDISALNDSNFLNLSFMWLMIIAF